MKSYYISFGVWLLSFLHLLCLCPPHSSLTSLCLLVFIYYDFTFLFEALSVCLSVHPSVCLSVSVSVSPSLSLPKQLLSLSLNNISASASWCMVGGLWMPPGQELIYS